MMGLLDFCSQPLNDFRVHQSLPKRGGPEKIQVVKTDGIPDVT